MCITVRFFTANSSSQPELNTSRQEVPSVPDTRPSCVPRSTLYSLLVQANQPNQQAAYLPFLSFIHLTLPQRSNLTFAFLALPCCVCVCPA